MLTRILSFLSPGSPPSTSRPPQIPADPFRLPVAFVTLNAHWSYSLPEIDAGHLVYLDNETRVDHRDTITFLVNDVPVERYRGCYLALSVTPADDGAVWLHIMASAHRLAAHSKAPTSTVTTSDGVVTTLLSEPPRQIDNILITTFFLPPHARVTLPLHGPDDYYLHIGRNRTRDHALYPLPETSS